VGGSPSRRRQGPFKEKNSEKKRKSTRKKLGEEKEKMEKILRFVEKAKGSERRKMGLFVGGGWRKTAESVQRVLR